MVKWPRFTYKLFRQGEEAHTVMEWWSLLSDLNGSASGALGRRAKSLGDLAKDDILEEIHGHIQFNSERSRSSLGRVQPSTHSPTF